MKPFDIYLAKQGKTVCTRDGHKVRIICFDKADEELPIVALVKREDGTEVIANYDVNGYYYGIHEDDDDNNDYDLMMASEKKTMYMNIYKVGDNDEGRCSGSLYERIEDAKASYCTKGSDYITTVKVEWEE